MEKMTEEKKEKIKKEGYNLTLQTLILIIIANISFTLINIFNTNSDYSMRSNHWFSYFIVGVTILVPLIGLREERKEYKNIRQLTYLGWFFAILLFFVTFNTQNSFSNALRNGEVVETKTYQVEDIKVIQDFYLTHYKISYKKNGKLETVTLKEKEAEDYKDYNRQKPSYKLKVTEYSYTKEFEKKYPNFERNKSEYKLVLERVEK